MNSKNIVFIFLLFLVANTAFARATDPVPGKKPEPTIIAEIGGACPAPSSRALLDINNVRTIILGGGDMWWNLADVYYEVPKVTQAGTPRRHSLFAGAIWVGGYTNGNLKVAAQTFRDTGTDRIGVGFWPGPLDTRNGTIKRQACIAFDRHWKVEKSQIDTHKKNTKNGTLLPGYTMPEVIKNWPGNGDPVFGQANDLAPYVDLNENNEYEPEKGDYPKIFGDQCIWYVFNDDGEEANAGSGSSPIGLEIQTQAFAFKSNDELNNMTFYTNKIINRGSIRLDSCFMAQWVDPDLGNANDDYLACDVSRGLGICYNGDENDETAGGYGENPPSVGVDFFQGPFSDANDGIDNDRDGLLDEIDTSICAQFAPEENRLLTERCIMSKFMYFNRDGAIADMKDPGNYTQVYGYMRGRWKNNSPLTYGGNGYNSSQVKAEMAFPGLSDQRVGWSVGGTTAAPQTGLPDWSEFTASNIAGDRRFVQSGGPFTLEAGAVNYVTVGVVWARATSGGPRGSFNLLLQADSKAQSLFDNCFKTVDGPDAPDLSLKEFDREIDMSLEYLTRDTTSASSNFGLLYEEYDFFNKGANSGKDSTYNFEGFQVFQLFDAATPPDESSFKDPSKARLVFQSDMQNTVSRIINYNYDPDLDVSIPEVKVEGKNKGAITSFKLNFDAFTGARLINHKQYYYTVVAYAHNEFEKYDPTARKGQYKVYLAGRNNVKKYIGIPHKTEPEFDGLILNAAYGSEPAITRLQGLGNGGSALELSKESLDEALKTPFFAQNPTYMPGFGPILVKVTDAKRVPNANFKLGMFTNKLTNNAPVTQISKWFVEIDYDKDGTTDQTILSDFNISTLVERSLTRTTDNITFSPIGLSVVIKNALSPGGEPSNGNGFIKATFEYADPAKAWLTALPDNDAGRAFNPFLDWIRSGPTTIAGNVSGDDLQIYESVLNGTWTPYRFASWDADHPAVASVSGTGIPVPTTTNTLNSISSVNVVLTADKSKWSRCIAVEMSASPDSAIGFQTKNRLRMTPSVDIDGNNVSTGPNDVGRTWFPGYAINVETGERLNIMFGEDSSQPNGKDLKWNPSSVQNIGQQIVWGGKHYLYIMKSRYDEGDTPYNTISSNGTISPINPNYNNLKLLYSNVMWVTMPLLVQGATLLNTDLTFKLRVNKQYEQRLATPSTPLQENNFYNPLFTFNTSALTPVKQDMTTAKSALDLIRVVPNPYYGYNDYETSQIDTRVKITNLPTKCTIKIFSLDGTLLRTLRKDDPTITSVLWDLQNQARIPISGGSYIIHVDAGDIGTKIVKFFCVMRPSDFDSF